MMPLDPVAPSLRILSATVVALLLLAPFPEMVPAQSGSEGAPVRYDSDYASPEFHAGRRTALVSALPDSAFVLVFSAPEQRRENSVYHDYRPSSYLYYLTGMHEPGSLLLLAPHGVDIDGRETSEVLFVQERTSFSDTWLGRRFGPEGAISTLGIEAALPTASIESFLRQVLDDSSVPVYVLYPRDPPGSGSELARQLDIVSDLLAERPHAEARSLLLQEELDRLRTVKQAEELRLMQRAIDITAEAHRMAMRTASPGMYEYEVEAVIEYVFHKNGAEAPAFPSIVASGENATILHYDSNRRRIEDGDLLLMDIGAEYRGYAADVTRTVPANGRFTDEQRAIYQIVLDAQEAGIAAALAGSPFAAPQAAASAVIEQGLGDLGILKPGQDVRDYFMHAVSHFLGLSVHDVGSKSILAPGHVITVEPGIYLKPSPDLDPRWWNIGVRIEDDVLITRNEPRVLSDGAPKTVEEIEALMAESCQPTAATCL